MDYRGLTVIIVPVSENKDSAKEVAEELNKIIARKSENHMSKSAESEVAGEQNERVSNVFSFGNAEGFASGFKSGILDGYEKQKKHFEQKKSVELKNPADDVPDIKTVNDLYSRAGILIIEAMESTADPIARAKLAHALANMSEYFVYYY